MVAQKNTLVAEYDMDSGKMIRYAPTTDAASTPPTAGWQRAVTQAAATMDEEPYKSRLQAAVELVLAGAVDDRAFEGFVVTSNNHPYAIDDERGCLCEDAKRRSKWCKHLTAVELYKRAMACMHVDTQAHGHNAPQTQEGQPMALHDETPQTMPQTPPKTTHSEAFAASTLCLKYTRIPGCEVSWTLRDDSDEAVAKRFQRQLKFLETVAEARGAADEEEETSAGDFPKPCPEHGMAKLKPSTKVAGQFYCTGKTGDAWCPYKWQAK